MYPVLITGTRICTNCTESVTPTGINTLVLLIAFNHFPREKTAKIRNFFGFGFWVGFGFMEHGVYPNKYSIREGVPGIKMPFQESIHSLDPSLTSDRILPPVHQLEGHSHDKPDAGSQTATGGVRRN